MDDTASEDYDVRNPRRPPPLPQRSSTVDILYIGKDIILDDSATSPAFKLADDVPRTDSVHGHDDPSTAPDAIPDLVPEGNEDDLGLIPTSEEETSSVGSSSSESGSSSSSSSRRSSKKNASSWKSGSPSLGGSSKRA